MAYSRFAARVALVVAGALLAANSPDARPRIGQRSSDCHNWDCQGGIICSCCFDTGCWICDVLVGSGYKKPDTDSCHWDDKRQELKVTPLNNSTVPQGTLKPAP